MPSIQTSPGFAAGIGSLLLVHILEHGFGGLVKEKRLIKPIKLPQSPEDDCALIRSQFGQFLDDFNHAHDMRLPLRRMACKDWIPGFLYIIAPDNNQQTRSVKWRFIDFTLLHSHAPVSSRISMPLILAF
jgi:hypothetical protein